MAVQEPHPHPTSRTSEQSKAINCKATLFSQTLADLESSLVTKSEWFSSHLSSSYHLQPVEERLMSSRKSCRRKRCVKDLTSFSCTKAGESVVQLAKSVLFAKACKSVRNIEISCPGSSNPPPRAAVSRPELLALFDDCFDLLNKHTACVWPKLAGTGLDQSRPRE